MKRKKRPEKRRATDEEMSRAADAKLKRYIANSAVEWAKSDQEVQRQMVAQTFGYHLPDEVEKRRGELRAYIDKLAIERLKKDDEFVRQVVEARIHQVAQEMGLHIEGRQGQRKPLSLDDYINLARKYKELKEALGIKEPGLWSSLMDPQVIAGILALIRQVFTKEQPLAEDKAWVLVQMDGVNRLIPKEEYEQITGKEPVAYIAGEGPSELYNEVKSNDQTSEPETPDRTEAEDGETSTTNPGD